MAKIEAGDLKGLRETLCLAQHAMLQHGEPLQSHHVKKLSRMINEIDKQRPLGSDGKHGNLHTIFCQCDVSLWKKAKALLGNRR